MKYTCSIQNFIEQFKSNKNMKVNTKTQVNLSRKHCSKTHLCVNIDSLPSSKVKISHRRNIHFSSSPNIYFNDDFNETLASLVPRFKKKKSRRKKGNLFLLFSLFRVFAERVWLLCRRDSHLVSTPLFYFTRAVGEE